MDSLQIFYHSWLVTSNHCKIGCGTTIFVNSGLDWFMVMHVDGVLELFSFLGVKEIVQQRAYKAECGPFVGFGNTNFFFWMDSFVENLFRMDFGSRVTCFRFLVYFSTKIKYKEEMTDGLSS